MTTDIYDEVYLRISILDKEYGEIMIIKAKYETRCPFCDRRLKIDEEINWEPEGSGASHVKCFKKNAIERLLEPIGNFIRTTGDSPTEMTDPEGEKVIDETNIYGGGYWYIIGSDWIWYVRNNSGDSDSWDLCNIKGVGPGGIGWKIPYNEDLAQKIRDLAGILINILDQPEKVVAKPKKRRS